MGNYRTKVLFLITIIFILIFTGVSAAEEVELEFWTINLSPRFDDYFKQMIDKYEADNPGITITWKDVSFSSVRQKLLYNIAEGNSPDVVNLSTELAWPLIQEEIILPISDINSEYEDDYFAGIWEAGVFKDKAYAFPWYVSTRILIYNKDIFMVSGLDPDSPPETVEELEEYAKIIKDKTGIYGFMPQIKLHHEFRKAGIPLFEGDKHMEPGFSEKKAEEIVRWYYELNQDGIIPEDTISEGVNLALERYVDEELGMLLIGPQFLPRIKEKDSYIYEISEVAAIPLREEEVLSAGVMNLAIPSSSKNPEEAAAFAHFITGEEAQLLFAERASVLPSVKAAVEVESIYNNKDELVKKAGQISISQLEKAVDMTLTVPESDLLLKVMDEQFARAFAGKITSEDAVKIMDEKWREILDKR
ncbi:MAG: ABC transporter substrate-binding protein [Bacillota bacterium]